MNMTKPSFALRGLKHTLAPIILLLITAAWIYGATVLSLPEKFLPYESFFLIFAAILILFFLAVTLPCCVYSTYLSVMAMLRDKKYVLPLITLLLDAAVISGWVYTIQYFF